MAVDRIRIKDIPQLRSPSMLTAFAGWADAGEAATTAVRYLADHLPATPFAEVDPEEFYDFTQTRPITSVDEQGTRTIAWPQNQFFYWRNPKGPSDVVLFAGIEPNLKWRTFTEELIGLAQKCDVKTVVGVGALLSSVPHTREVRMTSSASTEELRRKMGVPPPRMPGYRGPTGIGSALIMACQQYELPYASVWGHVPHYLRATPNLHVSYALTQRLRQLLDLDVDLSDISAAAAEFQSRVQQAVDVTPELKEYVRQLEEQFDSAMEAEMGAPSPESLVKDLEEFLKRQGKEGEQG